MAVRILQKLSQSEFSGGACPQIPLGGLWPIA